MVLMVLSGVFVICNVYLPTMYTALFLDARKVLSISVSYDVMYK